MEPHITSKRANSSHGFPRQFRLLRSAEFRKVYDQGRRRNLDFLVAFVLQTGRPISRVGLTAPRALGGAVERNLIKRRLREAVRRHLPELGPGWDIVFNARQSVKRVDFSAIEEAVKKTFGWCAEQKQP